MKSLLLTLAFAAACVLPAAEAAAPRPNIIFVLVDDMGWGDMGCFYQNARGSQPAMKTPSLDKMAAEGIQLRRHYCGSPVCAPSRASLFSGVHQGNARVVRDNTFDMPLENSHTLATVLKQAGYKTALIGKWGIGGGREAGATADEATAYPTRRGFDYFFGYLDHIAGHRHYPATDPVANNAPTGKTHIWDMEKVITDDLDKAYSTDFLTARAKKWIVDEVKADPAKPFFLALTYIAPHAALEVPTQKYPKGGGLKGGLQWIGTPGQMINTASGETDSFIEPAYERQKWPESAKRHATMIKRIDDGVGDIMQLLKDLNIDKNTLVVFSSDNGPHNEASFKGPAQDPQFFRSYGPFDGIKRDVFEGGMRVPTLVRWPAGIPAGKISTAPSQFHDWMATFAELAGVPVPARSDGQSIVPTLIQKGEQKPGIVYTEYNFGGKTPGYKDFLEEHRNSLRRQQQIIYVGPYKGIRRAIESADDDFQIFDVDKDPQESDNLAAKGGQYAAIQQQMKERVLQVRRIYDYANQKRGNSVKRPYDSAPVPGVASAKTQPGLAFSHYSNKTEPWVPQMPAGQQPVTVCPGGIVAPSIPSKAWTGQWTGYLHVPADGEYAFYVKTDANPGSKAFVRLHDMALIDADFAYEPGTEADSSAAAYTTEFKPGNTGKKGIPLKAGLHPVRIGYVHGEGEAPASLELMWKGPGIDKQPIPANAYSH